MARLFYWIYVARLFERTGYKTGMRRSNGTLMGNDSTKMD